MSTLEIKGPSRLGYLDDETTKPILKGVNRDHQLGEITQSWARMAPVKRRTKTDHFLPCEKSR